MNSNLATISAAAIVVASTLSALPAHAHIKLLKPPSWLNEDGLGGPQKGGPCGPGGSDNVTPVPMSNMVSTFKAGEKVTVEWTVTIPHPGWYRIALAKDRSELEDPDVQTDGFCNVDHATVPKTPHGNVLADGLFMDSSETDFSYEVTLPSEPCEDCTLQVIQYMEFHPEPCIYYHCSQLKIMPGSGGSADAGAGDATDAGAPKDGGISKDAGTSSSAHDAGGGHDAGHEIGDDDDDDDEPVADAGSRDAGAKKDASTKRDASEEDDDDDDDDDATSSGSSDDGCTIAGSGTGSGAWLLLIFGALSIRARRRTKRPLRM